MTRLNLLLLVALIASGIALVRVSYDSRRLYAALDKAQAEERQLEVDHERLQADKQSQATPSRVEAVARQQLAMRTATPAVTNYVTYARASGATQ
ncbi:MAG: cell division protein FtsL [Ideonella sp.]|nr:cell division protein FtsL [Ideonella sp.]